MSNFRHMSRQELLMRALEEDHAALVATSEEAQIAHRGLTDLMRQAADEMLEHTHQDGRA